MKLIKVAAAALNQTPLDWNGNKKNILDAIAAARSSGVGVLCLPELCVTGYGCEDAFHATGVHQMAEQVLLEIVPETRGIIVALGLPLMHAGGVFDAVALAADGEIKGVVCKQTLAGDGLHYEPRWFKPWPNGLAAETRLGGKAYPIGDLIFECGGVRIGFEICEEAWAAQRTGVDMARAAVDVLLNPSASHFAFGKHAIRERFVLEGSRAFGSSYVLANLLGNEAGRIIYDGGTMIASAGRMVANGPRLSMEDVVLTVAVIDVHATRMQRARLESFRPDLTGAGTTLVSADFDFPRATPQNPILAVEAWEKGPYAKEEEFARAVSLGLFDYLRKSRSHGLIVSLSGGADSAATAILAALLVRRGFRELGGKRFCEKLPHIPNLAGEVSQRDALRKLLTCVYQATCNSSRVTREAAQGVAEAIGAEFLVLDVDAIVQRYVALVEGAIGRKLSWEEDDLALQNIQARVRSPGVWLLANLKSALLLSTSNRSEAAVGYATMDGDTSGGLCPIAGIDKAFLRHWLRWMETIGPDGYGPEPALAAVNRQQPTAELRPPGAAQTDEADLMPYDLLDAIERAAIRDKQTPLETYQVMRSRFPNYTPADLGVWVERFFRLWCRNQWKRERYAPSFHVDDENLDPKTWCRFPILSGGFERELEDLRAFVRQQTQSPAA